MQGEDLRPWLFGKLQDPNIVGVVLFGESGAGKTTVASHIVKEITRLGGKNAEVTVISTGAYLTRKGYELTYLMRDGMDYKGDPVTPLGPKEEFDRSQLTDDMWEWLSRDFADNLNYTIERCLRADPRRPSVTRVLVADVAGIGDSILTGRIASGLGAVADAFPENIVFLAVPANPEIQDRSLRLRKRSNNLLEELLATRGRERIITAESIEEIGRLSEQEQLKITALLDEEHLVTDTDPVSTLVSIREGTRPGRFERVRDAFLKEVIDWGATGEYEKEIYQVERQLASFQIRGEFAMVDERWRGLYALKLAYAQNYLYRVLDIPFYSDQARAVLVPFLETPIYQWTKLLHQKSTG